jgi:hypothetical protein
MLDTPKFSVHSSNVGALSTFVCPKSLEMPRPECAALWPSAKNKKEETPAGFGTVIAGETFPRNIVQSSKEETPAGSGRGQWG